MRVIVTGGTGFIGKPFVSALAARGDEVVVVSRSPGEGRVAWGAIGPEIERADAVVHLAGEPIAAARWTASRLESIRASRVETTARLARAMEHASHKPRVFVSGSAVGFYGKLMSDVPLAEDSAPGDDELARIVVAWEGAARPARSAGTRVVHPRIGVVLGPGGGALEQLARPFKWFVGGPVGSGKQWVSWVHLRDAVRALLFAMDSDALAGPVNVVAPQAVSMQALAEALGRALRRPARVRVPAFALRVALGDGLAGVLLSGQRAVPSKLVAAGFRFEFPGIDEALAAALG
jgi:hypothetical protein